MFCPNCASEYGEDVIVCSKCNVPLTNEPPDQRGSEFVKFVTVHETGDPAFIAFAKSVLESENIRYFFKGEGIQDLFAGGRLGTGFNPVIGPVQIQVDEKDAEKVKELLNQIEAGGFENLEPDAEYNDAEKVEKSGAKRHTFRNILIAFIIGVLISAIGFYVHNYRQRHLSGIVKDDLNKDSKPDLIYYYENGVIVKTEQDRNFDGKMDLWEFYKDGERHHGLSDNNFDGIADCWFSFKNGLLANLEIDTNSDNKPEIIEYYTNEVLSEKLWVYESTRKVWKRALFEAGIMKEEYIDQDYDGTFDIKIVYDSSERPIKTLPLH
jgi:hypothetical protein